MWKRIEHTENDILYVTIDQSKTFANNKVVYKVAELYSGDNQLPKIFIYEIIMENEGYLESDMKAIWRQIDEDLVEPTVILEIESGETQNVKDALGMLGIEDNIL